MRMIRHRFKVWLSLRVFVTLMMFKKRKNRKLIDQTKEALIDTALLVSMEMFPDKNLIAHVNFVDELYDDIMIDDHRKCSLAMDTDFLNFKEAALKDQKIKNYISILYLLRFYFLQDVIKLLPSLAEKYHDDMKTLLKTARFYDDSSRALDSKTYRIWASTIQKELESIRQKLTRKRNEIIEREKVHYISPLEITNETLVFIISLISSLFIIGGYIHISMLLNHFDVNTSHYYSISDYLATSVDVIKYVFISTFITMVFFLFGLNSSINRIIIDKELSVLRRKFDWLTEGLYYLVTLSVVIILVTDYFMTGKINYSNASLAFLLIMLFVLARSPVFKYFTRPIKAMFLAVSTLLFLFNVIVNSYTKIQDIESGNYKSPYVLTLQKDYKEYEKMELITKNEKFLFMWHEEGKRIFIIPSSALMSVVVSKH